MQLSPDPAYDHKLVDRIVVYLQTKDTSLFPFTAGFDDARRRAFMRDLREALTILQDSGSARKTSAAGFIMSDQLLHNVVGEWRAANGDWPRGADPREATTSLGSINAEDARPTIVPPDAARRRR